MFSTLLASGGAAAAVRATAVRGGILLSGVRQPARVEVTATVAEEPHQLRYGGQWVVLTVNEVHRNGRTYRTRERAGMIVPRGRLPPVPGPSTAVRSAAASGLAVGERLRVRASVGEARWSDALGRQPPVVLRNPIIEERAPPGGAALRISERVRDAARSRALASLAPERAGLLVGMALGDTSLLPAELERDFRAAGLTHLMAVSGANLAVVLAAGLWLAGVAGVGRRGPGRGRDPPGRGAGRRHPLGAERAPGRGDGRPGAARRRHRARPGRSPCPLPGRGRAAAGRPGSRRSPGVPALGGGHRRRALARPGHGQRAAGPGPRARQEGSRHDPRGAGDRRARARPGLRLGLAGRSAGQPARPAARGRPDAAGGGRRRHRPGRAVGRDPRLPPGRPVPPRPDRGRPLGRRACPAGRSPSPGRLGPCRSAWSSSGCWRSRGGGVRHTCPAGRAADRLERTVKGRDDHRRRAPPGGAVTAGGGGARDLGAPDLPGPGQDVRHHVR